MFAIIAGFPENLLAFVTRSSGVIPIRSPGAPQVTIRGFSLWGSVGVKRKKRKAQQ